MRTTTCPTWRNPWPFTARLWDSGRSAGHTQPGFTIVYLRDQTGHFELELTWLQDHPQKYDLGECEFHLAFAASDFEAAHKKHQEMGCICYENDAMGIYFIEDPDGYWLEIVPVR